VARNINTAMGSKQLLIARLKTPIKKPEVKI